MGQILQEFNDKRKAHRVHLPLFVEIEGKHLKVLDWSISGIKLAGVNQIKEDLSDIKVRLIIPMADSALILNERLSLRWRKGDKAGFEFKDMKPQHRRVLRHYIELAVEGKLDKLEDIVAIISTPEFISPIYEPLTISESEAEVLNKQFRRRSVVSIVLGIMFIIAVIGTIFYYTTYRIKATGVVINNIKKVTSNFSGVIKKVLVKGDTNVDKGQPLFIIGESDIEMLKQSKELEADLRDIESKINELKINIEKIKPSLTADWEQYYKYITSEYKNAKILFKKKLINKKIFDDIYLRYLRAKINFEKEKQAIEEKEKAFFKDMCYLQSKKTDIERKLNVIREKLRDKIIYSPVKGRVFNIQYSGGEYVNPDDIIMLIEVDTRPEVVIKLRSNEVLRLKIGMPAWIYVPSQKKKYRAKIVAIGYSAINVGSTDTMEASLNETLVKLIFEDPTIRLPAHSRVEVWIKTLDLKSLKLKL